MNTRLPISAVALLVLAACQDSSAPVVAPPVPQAVPAFVYVADVGGSAQLVRFRNDSAVVLTTGESNVDPNSAASRLVFTSYRDGLPQIYISDLDVATAHRVTNSESFNYAASLSPSADSIVYVSTRSGTPRLWVIAAPSLTAPGSDASVALATGSPDYSPESGPRWNPMGHVIAFTSTRSGTSQVYVIASGGGTATQLTSEMGGAYYPSWSADGHSIYYIAASASLTLRKVSAQGGDAVTVVSTALGVGGPATCGPTICLFSSDPAQTGGSMSSLLMSGSADEVVFARTAAQERQPAFLIQ